MIMVRIIHLVLLPLSYVRMYVKTYRALHLVLLLKNHYKVLYPSAYFFNSMLVIDINFLLIVSYS